jgi:predicted Zn-dependent peptidase
MKQQTILTHQFANGLTLVGQPMPWLQSAAFALSVPAGSRYDEKEKIGTANFLCEMVQRGCGDYDSRQFVEALQMLGVDFSSSAGNYHTHFGGAMIASELLPALKVTADLLRRPHLPEVQLEEGRMVCLQEIAATADDLPQQAMARMKARFYGDPDGRDSDGTIESIQAITLEDLEKFHERFYQPDGLIIAVAGQFEFNSVVDEVGKLFDDWKSSPPPAVVPTSPPKGVEHIPFDSEQTHIIVGFDGCTYSDENYYLNRCAIGVLSDGMSSRLFTEVREKRGLCYTVFASNHSVKESAGVFCYAGTTTARAQETLDVILEQLRSMSAGVTEAELKRLKIQIRSGLVSQQESCRSRANAINSNWFHLGRVRTLDEILENINSMTVEKVNDYLSKHPPANFSLVTLGSAALALRDVETV